MCNLKVRLCINRSAQLADLEESYLSVCLSDSFHITITLATSYNLTISIIYVVNAYQNTLLEPKDVTCVCAKPFCKA